MMKSRRMGYNMACRTHRDMINSFKTFIAISERKRSHESPRKTWEDIITTDLR
jgi:hypothetical protein